jgi:transposase
MIAALKFVELVAASLALIDRMRDANTELTKQLANLRRKRPRSETLERLERQLMLPLVGIVVSIAKPKTPPEDNTKNKPSRKGRHPGRAAPPPHLERVPEKNLVPPDKRICPICGSEMKTVGYSQCEIYDIVPAKIVVIERMDERVACPHDDAIVSAPVPPAIVERGKLSDTLRAYLFLAIGISKYRKHVVRRCRSCQPRHPCCTSKYISLRWRTLACNRQNI